jgi:hypothetical protein
VIEVAFQKEGVLLFVVALVVAPKECYLSWKSILGAVQSMNNVNNDYKMLCECQLTRVMD